MDEAFVRYQSRFNPVMWGSTLLLAVTAVALIAGAPRVAGFAFVADAILTINLYESSAARDVFTRAFRRKAMSGQVFQTVLGSWAALGLAVPWLAGAIVAFYAVVLLLAAGIYAAMPIEQRYEQLGAKGALIHS